MNSLCSPLISCLCFQVLSLQLCSTMSGWNSYSQAKKATVLCVCSSVCVCVCVCITVPLSFIPLMDTGDCFHTLVSMGSAIVLMVCRQLHKIMNSISYRYEPGGGYVGSKTVLLLLVVFVVFLGNSTLISTIVTSINKIFPLLLNNIIP